MEVQQTKLDALRAKIRAAMIADARYTSRADKAKRFGAEVMQFTNVCLNDHGTWPQEARRLYSTIQGIPQTFITVCEAIDAKIEDVPGTEPIRRFIVEGGILHTVR